MKHHGFGWALAASAGSIVLFLAVPEGALAQPVKTGELRIPQTSLRGVEIVRTDFQRVAILNAFAGGVLHVVDVSDPATPLPCAQMDPPHGDSFHDSIHAAGGLLFTGHRFGGVNLIDVSNPCLPILVSSADTHYHFKGLELFRDAAGVSYLFESEHNASGRDGGLRIYDVSAGSLDLVGAFLDGHLSAGAIAVRPDGGYVFQFDNGRNGTEPNTLNVYDVQDKSNPALVVEKLDLGNDPAQRSVAYDMLLSADGSHLLTVNGLDGIKVIDVRDPLRPELVHVHAEPGIRFERLTFVDRRRTLAVVGYRDTSTGVRMLAGIHVADLPQLTFQWRDATPSPSIRDVGIGRGPALRRHLRRRGRDPGDL